MPPRHCTIHHELLSVAPREISCFTGRSNYALRLSFFVQDGAAIDCQDDEMVCTVTSVAEARPCDRYPPRRTSFGVLASFDAPPLVRLAPSVCPPA